MKKFSVLQSAVLALFTSVTACYSQTQYQLLKEIPIGGEGGWDYASVDSTARRLYVSHASKVVVIDLDADKIVGEITNTPGVHGVAIASDLGKGLVTCGRENKGALVDLRTLQITSKLDTGANPDGMLYEPEQKEFYTFNGRGSSATVIDAREGKVVATIPLGGKPEFPQADPAMHRVFDNLEDKSEVVAIDTQKHEVVNRWSIAPNEEPSGMAIDTKNHRLFLGCGGSKTMAMLDYTTGKVVASVPIGDGVDANAFDPETQLAFASCGDGTVTIAHEDSPEKLTVVQTLKTQQGSRTMTIDPRTHKIYLAAAKYEAGQGRRGRMTPDSFKVLVYGMGRAETAR